MEASFVFNIDHPADPQLKEQLSRALEKHVELKGRDQHPFLWSTIDRLRTRKGSPQRRSIALLRATLMLTLWLASLGLMVPGILTPGALFVPLIAGAACWLYASLVLYYAQPKLVGILSLVMSLPLFVVGLTAPELRRMLIPALCCLALGLFSLFHRRSKLSDDFSAAAEKLLAQRQELAAAGTIRVEFGENGMSVKGPDGAVVPSIWSLFSWVIETAGLYVVFFSDKVLFLEKQDLFGSPQHFHQTLKENTRLISLE